MANPDPKTELQATIDAYVERPTTFQHRGTDFTVSLLYTGITTDPNELWYKAGGPTQSDASPFQVYREAFELLIQKAKDNLYDLAVQRKRQEYDAFITARVEVASIDPRAFDEVQIDMRMKSHSKALATGYIPDPYLPAPLGGKAYHDDKQFALTDNAMRESRLSRPGVIKHRFELAGRFIYATPGDIEHLIMQLVSIDLARDYAVLEGIDEFQTDIVDADVADLIPQVEERLIASALLMIAEREKEGLRQQAQEDQG